LFAIGGGEGEVGGRGVGFEFQVSGSRLCFAQTSL
jgi:hypothetical protein